MADIVSHLARRGFEVASEYRTQNDGDEVVAFNIPSWGIALLALNLALYLFVMFSVSKPQNFPIVTSGSSDAGQIRIWRSHRYIGHDRNSSDNRRYQSDRRRC